MHSFLTMHCKWKNKGSPTTNMETKFLTFCIHKEIDCYHNMIMIEAINIILQLIGIIMQHIYNIISHWSISTNILNTKKKFFYFLFFYKRKIQNHTIKNIASFYSIISIYSSLEDQTKTCQQPKFPLLIQSPIDFFFFLIWDDQRNFSG